MTLSVCHANGNENKNIEKKCCKNGPRYQSLVFQLTTFTIALRFLLDFIKKNKQLKDAILTCNQNLKGFFC